MMCIDFNTIKRDGTWDSIDDAFMNNEFEDLLNRAGDHRWVKVYSCYDWFAAAVDHNSLNFDLEKLKLSYMKLDLENIILELNHYLKIPLIQLDKFKKYFIFHQNNLNRFADMVKISIESNRLMEQNKTKAYVKKN